MERAQVRVLEELNEVHLCSLLKREEGRRLKPHILFHFLRNLANESLERRFSNQQVGRSLVAADLPQSHCSWSIAPFLRRRRRHRSSGCRADRELSSRCLRRRLLVLSGRLLDSGHVQRMRWFSAKEGEVLSALLMLLRWSPSLLLPPPELSDTIEQSELLCKCVRSPTVPSHASDGWSWSRVGESAPLVNQRLHS
jgi:hypothetical protein